MDEKSTEWAGLPDEISPFSFTTSPEIGKIALALSKAQGAMKAAEFDRENPGFHFRYATIASIWEAVRGPLSANELAVTQIVNAGQLVTMLLHSSGQFLRSDMKILAKDPSAQGFGSGMTYARRYSLQAIVGAASADEDDDGQEASTPTKGEPKAKTTPKPAADRHPDTDRICPIHQTPFKLYERPDGAKWYSHKLDDGKWCNESKPKPKPAPEEADQDTTTMDEIFGPAEHTPEASSDATKPVTAGQAPTTGDIDANGLIALGAKLGWSSAVVLNRIRLKFTKPSTSLPNFTGAERAEFANEMLHLIADKDAEGEQA
ncbi:MAG: ERF family protein [Dehalococcoidia bacterium]|nr:ERF family protein [Dehalococcoidia bacterium]